MPRTPDELVDTSAIEQAHLIRKGELSSRELVDTYLARIALTNPALAAFVDVFARRARLDAAAKDLARIRAGRRGELPPFHGVPIGIKDLNLVRLSRAGFGSRGMGLWSPVDDRTTARLREAGFVMLGKLATSELGVMPVTEPDTHPPTRNPWDPRVSAGGSSGGSGSAVAAGLVPIAHGSDGAGSIRIPASLCHLYGFKPSRGRVANAYGFDDEDIMYTCGPLARSVGDAAAMLDAIALGSDGASFASQLDAPTGPLRIRLVLDNPMAPTHPEVREVVEAAARALSSLGHHVEPSGPPDGDLDEFLPIYQRMVASAPAVRWSKVQPVTRWLGLAGKRLAAHEVLSLQRRMAARTEAWLAGADLVLSPTVPVLPPRVASFERGGPEATFRAAAVLGSFTALFNLTGGAAASLPLGLSRDGLPVGVQLGGARGHDLLVLQVSRQLELALPWIHRRAPLFDEATQARASRAQDQARSLWF